MRYLYIQIANFFSKDDLTNNNKSKRKEWITNRRGIVVFAGATMAVVLIKNLLKCGMDNDILLICDAMETMLIVLGASMGAMLGFEVHQYEKEKNNKNTPPEK